MGPPGKPPANSGKYVKDKEEKEDWDEDKTDLRVKESRENDAIDAKYGFNRVSDSETRVRLLF